MNEKDVLAVFSTFDPTPILNWEGLRAWAVNETFVASFTADKGVLDTLRRIHFGAMAANFDEINFSKAIDNKFTALRISLQFGEYVDAIFSSILAYHRPVEGSPPRIQIEQEIVDTIFEMRHLRDKNPAGDVPSEDAIFYVVDLVLPGFDEIHQGFRNARPPDAQRRRIAKGLKDFLKPGG